jgi:L-histidine Nalpha-methyltransferase
MNDAESMSHASYRILQPEDLPAQPLQEFANAVLQGLSERPKRLSSRYLYDDSGSDLFQQIMALPEYYPTRCEAEILERHSVDIVHMLENQAVNVVDLGAGDGTKTQILLNALGSADAGVTYVPIDISEYAMRELTEQMSERLPSIKVSGLVAEYTSGIRWLTTRADQHRNLVLFLGSNIGNFNNAQARSFLRQLWSVLNADDYVLIGFDLKKDIDLLLAAYNDAAGVTAAFNLNLLTRINTVLGGNFDISKFRHYSTYDVFSGAMESYLVSMKPQTVSVEGLHTDFAFDAWEPVHTEYSYKYLESDVAQLAASTGFSIDGAFKDSKGWFLGSLWRVEK